MDAFTKVDKLSLQGNSRLHLGDSFASGTSYFINNPNNVTLTDPKAGAEAKAKAKAKAKEEAEEAKKQEEITSIIRTLHKSLYRDRKDRNRERVPGTCEWFKSHRKFQDWQESESSTTLWVSADPGCGKSVLIKHIIDSVLQSEPPRRTVCYFFFKDDFGDQKKVTSALCCVLHQLFTQRRELFSDAILERFKTSGSHLFDSFGELWDILIKATENNKDGEIICILDALDECEEEGRSQLSEALKRLYITQNNLKLKFLITSRPYDIIRSSLLPSNVPEPSVVHLSGESEEDMAKIIPEIDLFIKYRVDEITEKKRLSEKQQELLLQRLIAIPNRSYLWIYLTLDLVERDPDINREQIINLTSNLPETVDQAYDRILCKSPDPEKAKRILHIIVAAARPLTLGEMDVVLAIREQHQLYKDMELEGEENLRYKIRALCGLFVTIIDSKVYLLHQTAREFLVQSNETEYLIINPSTLQWKYSLQPQESHKVLAEICVWYLLLSKPESSSHTISNDDLRQYGRKNDRHLFDEDLLLAYSSLHWAGHFRKLPIDAQHALTKKVLDLCDITSRRFRIWFEVYHRLMADRAPMAEWLTV